MCTSVIQEDSIKTLNHKPWAYELLSRQFSLSKDRPRIPRTSLSQRSIHFLYFCIWTPRRMILRRFSEVFQTYPFARKMSAVQISTRSCRFLVAVKHHQSIHRRIEVTDWDKKFTRRQQTFSLDQKPKTLTVFRDINNIINGASAYSWNII